MSILLPFLPSIHQCGFSAWQTVHACMCFHTKYTHCLFLRYPVYLHVAIHQHYSFMHFLPLPVTTPAFVPHSYPFTSTNNFLVHSFIHLTSQQPHSTPPPLPHEHTVLFNLPTLLSTYVSRLYFTYYFTLTRLYKILL